MATATIAEPTISAETLFSRIDEITPIIEKHRDEAERRRQLSEPVIDAIRSADLLRLLLPRCLGGLEVDPLTHFRVAEKASRVDSAVGWEMMVMNSLAFIGGYLPADGAERLFGDDPKALACGTFNAPGKAVRVEGGYRFTGRSGFNSGCKHADWCMVLGLVEANESSSSQPEVMALFCEMKDLEIIDNWDVIGMCGTASDDVRGVDVFVPESMSFPFSAMADGAKNRLYQGDLYRLPLSLVVHTVPAVALGSLRSALDWVSDLALNKTPFSSSSKLRERSIAQINYGRALGMYRGAYALIEASEERVWSKVRTGGRATAQDKADLFLAGAQAIEMAAEGVKLAASVAGTSSIRKGTPLERSIRDIEVLRQHAYTNESRFGTASQVYWGLEPDFSFITL